MTFSRFFIAVSKAFHISLRGTPGTAVALPALDSQAHDISSVFMALLWLCHGSTVVLKWVFMALGTTAFPSTEKSHDHHENVRRQYHGNSHFTLMELTLP